jgi:soluble lytic murein transglycosylase-like protein
MRYAVVALLVGLGIGLAWVGPAAFQRVRLIAATDGAGEATREAAVEPAADEHINHAGSRDNQAVSQGKASPDIKASPAGRPPLAGKVGADAAGRDTSAADGERMIDEKAKNKAKNEGRGKGDGAAAATKPKPPANAATAKISGAMDSICLILESAATANGLPLEFFARVIWQESRFQPDAVGPVTRSGHRAQGIAQFMPYTAEERGLLDPFNPVAALPKAAEFLRELRGEFGNLGLAAAAYNAGPRRVRDYIEGRGGMPAQTRHYVRVITGRTVDDWVNLRGAGGRDVIAKPTSCHQLAALLTKQPSFFVGELERRVAEGKLRPWGVQLSAGFSRARVLQAYARIERQYRALLENRDPMIIRTVLRSRGTNGFYQVRVGVDTRAAANQLCAALHAKGAACMVLKNSHGSPELLSKRTDEKTKAAKEAKEEAKDSKRTR